MLFPSVKIKRVASASLVLGGAVAGCGDSDPNASLANRYCRHYQDCDPDDFEYVRLPIIGPGDRGLKSRTT